MAKAGERFAALTHALVVVALVALVGTIALTLQPPAPPGIAEFAPQAARAITKAPTNQSSTTGDKGGHCLGGGPCARPSPSARPSGRPTPTPRPSKGPQKASEFQCYSWPDGSVTQTFDPQSPPCIASWSDPAGNGGATATGVDATTIRIAAPEYTAGGTGQYRQAAQDVLRFVNSRFELYGRKFQLVDAPSSGDRSDPAVASATAREIATLHVFGAMELDSQGDQRVYRDSLAQHGIVSVTNLDSSLTDAELTGHAPYIWSFAPTVDYLERSAGEFVCTSLAGKDAQYAGGGVSGPRKFGVLVEDNPAPATKTLLDSMAACGVKPTVAHYTNPNSGNGPTCEVATPTDVQTQMLALQRAGVTTIIPLENEEEGVACLQVAAEQLISYQPEWFVPVVAGGIFDGGAVKGGQTNQLRHTFGITTGNKPPLSLAEAMHFQATKAVDPGFSSTDRLWFQDSFYNQMLLLASGVQAAGPHLTARSFASGLEALEFPNPGAAQAPFWQATVGFRDGQRTMIRDVGLWWYDQSQPHDPSADPTFTPHGNSTIDQGGRCFAQRGARWAPGGWPPHVTLFSGPCR